MGRGGSRGRDRVRGRGRARAKGRLRCRCRCRGREWTGAGVDVDIEVEVEDLTLCYYLLNNKVPTVGLVGILSTTGMVKGVRIYIIKSFIKITAGCFFIAYTKII